MTLYSPLSYVSLITTMVPLEAIKSHLPAQGASMAFSDKLVNLA